MSDRLPAGPYRMVALPDGTTVPWYIVPFDEDGVCEGPETRAHLIDTVRNGTFTDIYLFSHGWNNDWEVASRRYDHFLHGYIALRQDRGLGYPRAHRPILVGIFWPSTALVLPWEQGPEFAARSFAEAQDAAVAAERREVQEVASALEAASRERFYSLAQRAGDLSESEARELASLLIPLYRGDDDERPGADDAYSVEALVDLWRALPARDPAHETSGAFGFADAARPIRARRACSGSSIPGISSD